MAGYQPLKIAGFETGLVQEREEFLLPNDAYPVLENAYVWRERIKRKKGYQLLGRLRRKLIGASDGVTAAAVLTYSFNLYTDFGIPITEVNKEIEPGSVFITIGAPDNATFTDNGLGGFTVTGVGVALNSSINYITGAVTINISASIGGGAITSNMNYFPALPVMGLRTREVDTINNEVTIAFDQVYAYRFTGGGWQEFIPGTVWTGTDSDFFWTTNYWVTPPTSPQPNRKLFWETNFTTDPIRYTEGTVWDNFAPVINNMGHTLVSCRALLPFRGRLVAFNTIELEGAAGRVPHRQRIRWAAIGTPITVATVIFPTGINVNAWRDDLRGQGGFLDIPTTEDIISVGFVRDNLVIYCERSTWQLRYTGRSIAPFQIEKVNSELGAESTFSSVQFDTSLVGIGDKGVVQCDSFKSSRIDIKIPDLVFQFNNDNEGPKRIHGIRDFTQRLAYWTYPYKPDDAPASIYPNRRLVYNYENESWAIFTDSLTTLGTFQPIESRTWAGTVEPWQDQNYPWINRPSLFPTIIGGNQQGFVEYLDQQVTNDISLSITDIIGGTINPTIIRSPNHNLITNQVIKITGIPAGTPFAASLNNQIFGIVQIDANQFEIWKYNAVSRRFTTPQLDAPGVYIGGGKIAIRDGFQIVSKKFNNIDDGQNTQLGYLDVLMNDTSQGAVSLYIFLDYNEDLPVNILPENILPGVFAEDKFFNATVPTTRVSGLEASKNWQRVFCPVRGAFITLMWTLSNAQLVGVEQESDVQIDAQILWMRKAGRQLPVGV